MSGVSLAAACVLQLAHTDVRPIDGGWLEELRLTVIAEASTCSWVDVALPAGTSLSGARGRVRLGDGTGRRLGQERFEELPRSLQDEGGLRVHLPELLSGDRAELRITRRRAQEAAFVWEPGPARHAEVRAPRQVRWDVQGAARHEEDKGLAWVRGDEHGSVVLSDDVRQGSWTSPFAELLPPAAPVDEERRLTLMVPPGDPQRTLYPGGGATTRTEVRLQFAAEDRVRGWLVPLPAERADLTWTVEPRGAAEVVERTDGVVLLVAPSEGRARVAVAWTEPDAPTYGERPPGLAGFEVSAPGGLVVWEGSQWLLAAIHDRPVLPAREALLRALDHRFRGASMPEPGLPNRLRGMVPGWEAAALLRDAVHDRVVPGAWPADALWPRKVHRARASGAASSTELALVVWLYARQLGLDAQWALIRPATSGSGGPTSPSGYDEALVQITHDGEARWIDPSCTVCGPFEVRPELEGASAIAPGIEVGPPPTRGTWTVELGTEGVRWALDGPPALELRRWLDTLPESARADALAARMGGPGAELVRVSGVDQPGEPITAVSTRTDGAADDPLGLPVIRTDDTAWIPWIGERRLVQRDADLPDAEVTAGPLTWRRTRDGDAVVEELIVEERSVSSDAVRAIRRARAAPAEPPPDPDHVPDDIEPEAGDEPVDDAIEGAEPVDGSADSP